MISETLRYWPDLAKSKARPIAPLVIVASYLKRAAEAKRPLATAVSAGRCNTPAKRLRWSFEAKRLAWPPISLPRDFTSFDIRVRKSAMGFLESEMSVTRRVILVISSVLFLLLGAVVITEQFVDILY